LMVAPKPVVKPISISAYYGFQNPLIMSCMLGLGFYGVI
jgi:hypothetical protein